ncbi:MAG TPA: cation transporter [Thiolapillus brandeum]|uniref:Cation transporter n=1 Tax=Thiolapillus brandeum TaxID=1076588 RepID=A0A831KC10_9GAMM|nr:cation transporter [Thiolapillus brandeum]
MNDSSKPIDDWDVRRYIKLTDFLSTADAAIVRNVLGTLRGVNSVNTEVGKNQVVVVYDASKLDYRAVLKALETTGVFPARGWWSRIRGSMYQFSDGNARDNAKVPPPVCCNKPPK